MFKKILIFFTLAVFTLGPVAAVFAADGPDGNHRKGKYTYRKVIKACHENGGVDSPTPTVSPADMTRAEWKPVFENRNFEAFGCQAQWDELSDQDILDIYSYFYEFAKDSPSPATCS
ncbi:MAG: cytochrome c family protein [Desulfotignum sp.]|nr:cytochrome c family protein [Desulfotignum sp.]